MDSTAHVRAGWALWGKHPGSNSDYSVLASSTEPLTQSEFASVLTHFAPGTPPTEDGLPSSLPWVIISRVGIEDRPYLGMAIQKPANEVDGTGRPITLTSYFCVPYAELAKTPVSYAGLFRELDAIQLPYASDGLVQLNVPRLDPVASANEILREFGEASVAGTAALMMCRPVSITGSEGTTVYDRLRYLDAVAAMLPYGYRADFTAATWSDSGARHQIRLAFAAKAREDATAVRWRSVPAGLTDSDPGGAYLSLLHQIRGRRPGQGGQADPGQLADLIGFFARDTSPGLFDQPQRAIASLRDFDLAFIVERAVREGSAQPDEVRAVFLRSRITELPPEGRQTLLSALIALGDPQDIPTIRTWWDLIVGSDSATMLSALVRICRQILWTPAPNSLALKEYLTLAASFALLDDLLAELMARPETRSEHNGGLGAAAQLLADRVLSTPADFVKTQQAMADNPLVACELLAQLAGSGQDSRRALAWLQPPLGEFLRPFYIVLSEAPGAVDQAELTRLASQDVNCVGILLQAASYAGQLALVLPAFAKWLALDALEQEPPAAVRRQWYDLAWALRADNAISWAWLDLALLVSGNHPRFLLIAMAKPDREQYNNNFATGRSELVSSTGQAIDDLLMDILISYLDQASWTSDAVQIDAVVSLTRVLTSDGRHARLQSTVADSLPADPAAASQEPAQAWLAQLRPSYQETGGSVVDYLQSLRGTRSGIAVTQLAKLCALGFHEGLTAHEVCEALAAAQIIDSGDAAIEFLDQLRLGILVPQPLGQEPQEWLVWFVGRFADGTFGLDLAEEFKRVVVLTACHEIGYHLNVLYVAATGGRQDSPPELSDAVIAQLEWIPRSIDKIIKEARKRPSRPNIFRGRQGREEDRAQHQKPGRSWRDVAKDRSGQP